MCTKRDASCTVSCRRVPSIAGSRSRGYFPSLRSATFKTNDLVYIRGYGKTNYKYRRSSWSNTSFGFSTLFHFALPPSLSKIHPYPRSQRLLIWFFVPIDSGMSSKLSMTPFASRTTRWSSLTDRLSWKSEDGSSFFCSAIVFLRSSLEYLLDLWCTVSHVVAPVLSENLHYFLELPVVLGHRPLLRLFLPGIGKRFDSIQAHEDVR